MQRTPGDGRQRKLVDDACWRASPVAEEPAGDQADEEEAELWVLVVELKHLVAVDDRESAVALADGSQCADPVRCEQADFAEYVSDAGVRLGLE